MCGKLTNVSSLGLDERARSIDNETVDVAVRAGLALYN